MKINFKLLSGKIEGVIRTNRAAMYDERGYFHKIYSSAWSDQIEMPISEVFLSESKPGTLRGMHLQIGTAASDRIISVLTGKIYDVLLDLRPNSPTYLNYEAVWISPTEENVIFVPKGVAHGFQCLTESLLMYLSSEPYVLELDSGVNPLSLPINWPLEDPIMSARDRGLPGIAQWLKISE